MMILITVLAIQAHQRSKRHHFLLPAHKKSGPTPDMGIDPT